MTGGGVQPQWNGDARHDEKGHGKPKPPAAEAPERQHHQNCCRTQKSPRELKDVHAGQMPQWSRQRHGQKQGRGRRDRLSIRLSPLPRSNTRNTVTPRQTAVTEKNRLSSEFPGRKFPRQSNGPSTKSRRARFRRSRTVGNQKMAAARSPADRPRELFHSLTRPSPDGLEFLRRDIDHPVNQATPTSHPSWTSIPI